MAIKTYEARIEVTFLCSVIVTADETRAIYYVKEKDALPIVLDKLQSLCFDNFEISDGDCYHIEEIKHKNNGDKNI